MAPKRKITPLKLKRSPFPSSWGSDNSNSPFKARAGDARRYNRLIGGAMGRLSDLKHEFRTIEERREYEQANLYADVKNPYARIQQQFENVYEDLPVETKRFELEQQMFQRSQAQTLQRMQEMGMVNVQALAEAATQRSAQAAAQIGQQEAQNARMRAQGAAQVQEMERQAELQVAQGSFEAEKARLQGLSDARSLEYQRIQGLMSLEAGELQSLRADKQANRNWGQRTYSDRRLKQNIVFIKKSPSGLNIYNFEYKDSKFGSGIYQGVMSDEIPQDAVVRNNNGYDMVDYSKLDVDFVKIKN